MSQMHAMHLSLKLEEADNVEELYECRIYSEVIWQYYEGSNDHFEELFNQQNKNLFRNFWSDLDCYQFETIDNYELGLITLDNSQLINESHPDLLDILNNVQPVYFSKQVVGRDISACFQFCNSLYRCEGFLVMWTESTTGSLTPTTCYFVDAWGEQIHLMYLRFKKIKNPRRLDPQGLLHLVERDGYETCYGASDFPSLIGPYQAGDSTEKDLEACSGNENKVTLIGESGTSPSLDNLVGEVEATTTTFKVSVEVFCASISTESTLVQLNGDPGFYKFSISTRNNHIYVMISDPKNYSQFFTNKVELETGLCLDKWITFSLYVRQFVENPLLLLYTVTKNDVEIYASDKYAISSANPGMFYAYVGPTSEEGSNYSESTSEPVSSFLVRNFFYITYDDLFCWPAVANQGYISMAWNLASIESVDCNSGGNIFKMIDFENEEKCYLLNENSVDSLVPNEDDDEKTEINIFVCDRNECQNQNICGESAECQNTEGSYFCICAAGYILNITSEPVCDDIDECSSNNTCSEQSDCINLIGSYECACKTGFEGFNCNGAECADGDHCTDIDECENFCLSEHTNCTNTPGSYLCSCATGFYLHEGECLDVNECVSSSICPEFSSCRNTVGSYLCDCQKGFAKEASGDCDDIDECLASSLCEYDCLNTVGGYMCVCPVGTEAGQSGECTRTEKVVVMNESSQMTKKIMSEMVDNEMSRVVNSIDYAMTKMVDQPEKVTKALAETAAALTKTIRSMVAPKLPEDDPYLDLIFGHMFEITMSKSKNMLNAINKMSEFLAFGNAHGKSDEFFKVVVGQVGNLTLPNLEVFHLERTRSSSGYMRVSQINANPFIHSLNDLSLDPFVFLLEGAPSEILLSVKKESNSHNFAKTIKKNSAEVFRFELEEKGDVFIFLQPKSLDSFQVYLNFWRAPNPDTDEFIEKVFLPDWDGVSEITSIDCKKDCEGNPFGFHLREEFLDLCFVNDHCSIFLRIENWNAPQLSLQISVFSSSCLVDQNSRWERKNCRLTAASTDTEVFCRCENLTEKAMITTRTNTVITRENYISETFDIISTWTVSMVPLIIFFIWAAMLIQARFNDRLTLNQLRLRPVRSLSGGTNKRWYILTLETRFSLKTAPSEVNLLFHSTDWIGNELSESVTVGEGLFNGGKFCFLVRLEPGLTVNNVEIEADVTAESGLAFYLDKVEIREIICEIADLPKIFKVEKYSSVKIAFYFDGALTTANNSLKILNHKRLPSAPSFQDLLVDHFLYENLWTTPCFLKRYSYFSQTMRRLVGGTSIGIVIFINYFYYSNIRPDFVFISLWDEINFFLKNLLYFTLYLSSLFSKKIVIYGHFYLSPHLLLSSLIAIFISTALSSVLKFIIETIPPAELSCLSRKNTIITIFNIRRTLSLFLTLLICWLAVHCAIGYQYLPVFDRELLATSVFVSVMLDIFVVPLLKSYVFSAFIYKLDFPLIVVFPGLKKEYLGDPSYSKIFKSTTSSLDASKALKRTKQRRDILKTFFKFAKLGFIAGSLLGLTSSIVPPDKFFIDSNVRNALEPGLDNVLSMKDIWTFLKQETIMFIHPEKHSVNGEKMAVENLKFASDLVNFRLGPATLKQFRSSCGIFEMGWNEKESNETRVIEKMKLSPLNSPWLSEKASLLSSDINLKSPVRVDGCEYLTVLGTSKMSGKFILDELKKHKWMDSETSLLIFEQSFLQAHSNAFVQLRVIFEIVDGGGVVSSLTICQLRKVDLSDNVVAFSLALFCVFLVAQLVFCLKLLFKRQCSFYVFFHVIIMFLDLSIVSLFFYRSELLRLAMDRFTMNPKGTPEFGLLFLVQYHFNSLVSVSLFLHTLYLIHIFSTLNIVSSYKTVIKSLRKTLSPFMLSLLPVQFGLASIIYLIFQNYSPMYKSIVETFMVIIWQGYLRPSDMREEVQRLPGDLAPLAKLIYLFLNFSMLFLVINIIITIICDENSRVRKIEQKFDWLPFTTYWTKKQATKLFKRTKTLFAVEN
ncbi:unnamed protein product [Oikopleura dioica]|uniref:EGF-like domain-containing protein n=1 Tax=Oikopleura dioica TaxID=34765 RepID=E4XR04_OIKDI|nr:unnamed protein product [Oikopleura dioica]